MPARSRPLRPDDDLPVAASQDRPWPQRLVAGTGTDLPAWLALPADCCRRGPGLMSRPAARARSRQCSPGSDLPVTGCRPRVMPCPAIASRRLNTAGRPRGVRASATPARRARLRRECDPERARSLRKDAACNRRANRDASHSLRPRPVPAAVARMVAPRHLPRSGPRQPLASRPFGNYTLRRRPSEPFSAGKRTAPARHPPMPQTAHSLGD